MRDRFIDESIEEIANRGSVERFANARIPSAKADTGCKRKQTGGRDPQYVITGCACVHAESAVPSCRPKKNVLLATVRKGQGALY